MRTQNPLVATPCGFKSHRRHQLVASVISLATIFLQKIIVRSFCCSSLPRETLLRKFSWGPWPPCRAANVQAVYRLRRLFLKVTGALTSLRLLLPAKLCFANFRGGPGRPAGRQTCKLCIACGGFFVKVTGALILLLLASPPCQAAAHCAPFRKPGRLAGLSLLFSFQSSTPLAARAFPGENAHGSTALSAHLCRHSQLRGAAFV